MIDKLPAETTDCDFVNINSKVRWKKVPNGRICILYV